MRLRGTSIRVALALGGLGVGLALLSLAWPETLTARSFAWLLLFQLPLYVVGLLAIRLRPELAVARLLALFGSAWMLFTGLTWFGFGVSDRAADGVVQALAVGSTVLGPVAGAVAATFFLTYPEGIAVRGYERLLVRGVWLLAALTVLLQLLGADRLLLDVEHDEASVANPLQLVDGAGVGRAIDVLETVNGLALAVAVLLLLVRYRQAGPDARVQLRWLLLVPITATVLALLVALLRWAELPADGVAFAGEYLTLALVPSLLVVAILRLRLLDVDVVIGRSLAFGAISALIGVLYVAAATAVGLAGSQRLPVAAAVVVTVAATLLFQPLRNGLGRAADRWLFGRRLGGRELLVQLGEGLASTADRATLLQRLAEVVRDGLRVRWVEASLSAPARTALAGQRAEGEQPALTAPLVHGEAVLGEIACGERLDGRPASEDADVLSTLAGQAALALHNVSLSEQLAEQVETVRGGARELDASRARIVAAAEAERRRIERDLHDGAQQQVVALLARLRLARNQVLRDPAEAAATLAELERETAALHEDLVELSRGIHPAVLTDHGLVEAIRSRVAQLPLRARVEVDEAGVGRLPEDIEAAAYFVCTEALTNVLKHAGDTDVLVSLAAAAGELRVAVEDHGSGFNGVRGRGSGLANMSDRVASLGGTVEVRSEPGRGTRVVALLPTGGLDG